MIDVQTGQRLPDEHVAIVGNRIQRVGYGLSFAFLTVTNAVGNFLPAQGFARADTLAVAAPAHSRVPSIFAPLTLGPAPSATRLANGAPGPKYWQNRTDYYIRASLDTATQTLSGSMTLRYTNHSPDTLRRFWFQTEQRTDAHETFTQFTQLVDGRPAPLAWEHPDSDIRELTIPALARPIAPGQTTTFQVQWTYHVMGANGREGRRGARYALALWYPRPNVYDDVKGWNTESYKTGAEFYLEYGDYTLELTVPAGYVVAATGTLQNPEEVLTPVERARLREAMTVDTVIHVVSAEELAPGAVRSGRQGVRTWRFHAEQVRDAVWCTAPDYQWDATHWRHTLVNAVYAVDAAPAWHEAADMVRMSLDEYSTRWFPYPYPQATTVGGPVGGMEYPMLAMTASTTPDRYHLYQTITHEIGHQWFPMVVGSNERMHAWMDEGFNTFINTFSEARRYPEKGDQAARVPHAPFADHDTLETGRVTTNKLPMYDKTARILELLRRDVLGAAVFDDAFRTYIRRWAYKHPTPVDFFRTMEDVSHRDLAWFWREGFLEAPVLDQAIDTVQQTVTGSMTRVTVTYGNHGRAVMPLLVRFTFSDGTTQRLQYPVDVWRADSTAYTVSYTFANKTVRQIVLDPDSHLGDANLHNNIWKSP